MSIDIAAEKTAWKALEPYAQLVMWLMPHSDAVRVFDSQGWLRWSNRSTTGTDLAATVQSLQAEARDGVAISGRTLQLDGDTRPVYLWWLRDDQGRFVATVAISVRDAAPAEHASFAHADTLVHPAMECLRRELAARAALLNLHHSLSARDRDVAMLLEVADRSLQEAGDASADELKILLQNASAHFGAVLATLIVPDRNIAMMRPGAAGEAPDAALVSRMHHQLLQLMQQRREPIPINRIVSRGELVPFRILCSPVRHSSGRVIGLLALFRELGSGEFADRDAAMLELVARKAAASIESTYDTLTGLLTQPVLERRARAAVAEPAEPRGWSMLHVDCDALHRINEQHGMPAGDEALARVGEFLRRRLPPDGLAARIGGDRFALLLPMKHDEASGMAEVLRRGIEQLGIVHGGARLAMTVTIGVAQLEQGPDPVGQSLALAEAACRSGKDRGRNRVEVDRYADFNIIRRVTDITSAEDFREAVAAGRLRLEAQPLLPAAPVAGGPVQFEILLRMIDGRGEPVGPERFLATLRRYRLMPMLDRWVVEEALARLAPVAAVLARHRATVSINVSGQSLADDGFADFLSQTIAASGVPAAALRFEFAEGDAVAHVARAEVLMRRLRQLGCGVALDDFGTGLSSLAYLRALPVTQLKVDGSFVRDILVDARAESMVKAVAQLARTLAISTVAEGVETDAIRERLAELGIDHAQGFAVARPVPLEQMLDEMARREPVAVPAPTVAAPVVAPVPAPAVVAPAAVAPVVPAPPVAPAPVVAPAPPPRRVHSPAAVARPVVAPPSPAPVQSVVELPVLQPVRNTRRLDRAALSPSGQLSFDQQQQLGAQFRRIKRPIIATALGRGGTPVRHGNVVMIASAVPGEGKSFTSLNLALSIAREKDLQVVLIDADVAKRQLSEMLGVKAEQGLMDVLSEEFLALEDVVIRSEVPSLSVIPAGRLSDHATELLSSERMQRIVDDLATRVPNRIVIVDSPPVLLTTEARALAEIAGQIILVVRAGMTEQHVVKDAIAQLQGRTQISLVLNQSTSLPAQGYYYGYGEQHGQPAA